jgi:GntR family transcriptional repressor for pyruvate dehydrogenase complex
MALHAVKRMRIHEDIVTQIRRQLAEGRLGPGDQLPSERDLSEKFRVSRASVREAIRTLESTGLVRIRSGDGTYIASDLDTLNPLALLAVQPKAALRDAFETRKIIEPEIAALASSRATELEIGRLATVLREQARDIEGGGTGMESDNAFHALLATSTKNQLLVKLNTFLVERLRELRERSLHTRGRPARSLAGHCAILEAIRARNPARARLAMLRHLTEIEQNVMMDRLARPRGPSRGAMPRRNGRRDSSSGLQEGRHP